MKHFTGVVFNVSFEWEDEADFLEAITVPDWREEARFGESMRPRVRKMKALK